MREFAHTGSDRIEQSLTPCHPDPHLPTYHPTRSDSRVTAGVAPDASAAAADAAPASSPEQKQSPSPARRSLLRRNVGDDHHGLRRAEAEGVEDLKAVAITADHKPDMPAERVRIS